MNATKTGLAANVVGIIGLLLGMFGIERDSDSQATLIGAAGIVGLIINQAVIAWAQRQQPAAPKSGLEPPKSGGFITVNFATFLAFAAVVAVVLASVSGCATTAVTPAKSITAASVVIEQLALQIDQAQKSGQISNAREDELLDQLKAINGDLRMAYALTGQDQLQSLEQINMRLTALRAELAKERAK